MEYYVFLWFDVPLAILIFVVVSRVPPWRTDFRWFLFRRRIQIRHNVRSTESIFQVCVVARSQWRKEKLF